MKYSKLSSGIETYSQILKKYWIPGLTTFSVVLALSLLTTLLKKPIYEAEAKLKIKPSTIDSSLSNVQENISSNRTILDRPSILKTEAEIISSIPLINKTIAELNLKNRSGELLDYSTFLKRLQISQVDDTKILTVKYRDVSPEKAQKVVNTLITNYQSNNTIINRAAVIKAKQSLESELPEAEQEIEETEALILQFKENNQVISSIEEIPVIVNKLGNVRERIANLKAKIFNINSQSEYIKSKLGMTSEQALVASRISQTPTLQKIVERLESLELQLAKQIKNFPKTDSRIVELKKQISIETQALQQQISNIEKTEISLLPQNSLFGQIERDLTVELIKLEANNLGLEKEVDYLIDIERQYQQQVKSIPRIEEKLQKLERKLKTSQSNYDLLFNELRAIEISQNRTFVNARVVSYATTPKKPLKPRYFYYLASVGLALLASAIVMAIIDLLDKSLKSVKEAKDLFGYNWLGVIPNIKESYIISTNGEEQSQIPRVIVKEYPASSIAESYRMLFSNLKFLRYEFGLNSAIDFGLNEIVAEHPLKSITITSSIAGEGKSTIAANLACAIAQVGKKVILVDGDLHNPTQHQIWNVKNDRGLSEIIKDKVDARLVSVEVIENLSLVTAGSIPSSPAALLDSETMKKLINNWSQYYDYIIIDSPSLDIAADAPILGHITDGMLLVVRPGYLERSQANFAKDILARSASNVLGIVFNGISKKVQSGNYYYLPQGEKQKIIPNKKSEDLSQGELWETISKLAQIDRPLEIDSELDNIDNLSTDEIANIIIYLQQDLEELTNLVKEQEDELLVQRQTVKKLKRKVNLASEVERSKMQKRLSQEQEIRNMLDRTLVGQKRNLETKRDILNRYQQALADKQNQ